jgi:hypothetical protein
MQALVGPSTRLASNSCHAVVRMPRPGWPPEPRHVVTPVELEHDAAGNRLRPYQRLGESRRPAFKFRRSSVPNSGLDNANHRSAFVLMAVETLGVARSLGSKVHMRCTAGYRESTRSMRRCVYRKQLDLETLVSTRGPNFPLSRLESRLMCPTCGNRRVTVVFEPPTNREVHSG